MGELEGIEGLYRVLVGGLAGLVILIIGVFWCWAELRIIRKLHEYAREDTHAASVEPGFHQRNAYSNAVKQPVSPDEPMLPKVHVLDDEHEANVEETLRKRRSRNA